MRDATQDAEVTDLLRQFDRVTARLFELGVNPYRRCICPWSEPHSVQCPLRRPPGRVRVRLQDDL